MAEINVAGRAGVARRLGTVEDIMAESEKQGSSVPAGDPNLWSDCLTLVQSSASNPRWPCPARSLDPEFGGLGLPIES